jgi:hypothetical protein
MKSIFDVKYLFWAQAQTRDSPDKICDSYFPPGYCFYSLITAILPTMFSLVGC